ncbi:MAG: helix-turn-helix transcriptional regulator [Pseudomonadota bacterium]
MTAQDLNSSVGSKVRSLRKILGLSQSDLAQKLNISYQQLQKYETGENNISINKLDDISKALEYSIPELLDHHDDSSNFTHMARLLIECGDSKKDGEEITINSSMHKILQELGVLEDENVKKKLLNLLHALNER